MARNNAEESLTIIESAQPSKSPTQLRFRWLYLLLIAAVALIGGRSFFLQVISGTQFRAKAEGNRVALLPLPAPRGIIYDTHGLQLVENVARTDLVLDPALLPSQENEAYLIERLPKLLPEINPEEVQKALQQVRHTNRALPLAKALEHESVLRIEEAREDLPGVQLVSSLARRYLKPFALAHVVGYTSPVTVDELETDQSLLPTDTTGKTGVEKVYDSVLRGRHGAAYTEINAAGRPQKDLGREEPYAGRDITLSIDSELQEYIYTLFSDWDTQRQSEKGRPLKGAVVALDPTSGALRALVSYPSFDPNVFSQAARTDDAARLFQDEDQPLFNRAAAGMYPPGSTIKPFLAVAALEEGIITPETIILSTGGLTIGPWRFPDWKAGGHGPTDVTKAIAESVNTFFYIATGGDETRQGLGVERATAYLRSFGWGQPTNIDLANEAAGFLPSMEWKEREKGERWYIGDTYHLGIGQGDVLVTPLQLSASAAAIANGGYLYQPYLNNRSEEPQRLPVAVQHIETARAGMRRAVTEGSGVALNSLSITLAGKTGTAQIGGSEDTHAWFTSFGPYENPELVVTVLLERGGEGDEQAVPFSRAVWQWWIDKRKP